MAYTYEQMVQAWTAVHDGIAPDAATAANFQIVAVMSANGQMSDAQILSNIVNSADNSTALAILSYQFFTGKSPTKAGIDYLVNSTINETDLNDAYYAKFNIENRYINFAANLGVNGEGAANFASKYGAMSFDAYVASIYQTIIGNSYAAAAGVDVAKAIADIISRKDAILATVQSAGMIKPNATTAEIDLALKVATAGYLMVESIKADVGIYAAAANNFMVAMAQGTATYNTDITKTYEPTVDSFSHGTGKAIDRGPTVITPPPVVTPPVVTPPSPLSFTLTNTNDTFAGAGTDDTFTGTSANFAAGDTLTGGAGNDTLTITATGAFTAPAATISGIETVTINGDNTVSVDTTPWTGVTALNVTSVGQATVTAATTSNATVTANTQAAGAITVNGGNAVTVNANNGTTGTITVGGTTAPTGAVTVNVNSNAASALGAVTVTGGTTVTVNATNSNANATTQTTGAITVNGKATTTAVTIKAPTAIAQAIGVAGVTANTVTIIDLVNGGASTTKSSITSISVDGATTVGIADNALSNLSVAHTSGNLIIDNSSNLSVGNKTTTLALTLNGTTGGTLDDADVYTTINATTGAQASTLANITFGALTTLNLAGASQLTVNSTAGMTNLATVTVTGSAGIVADLSGRAALTSVTTAASTGTSTTTISGATTAYTGGAGVDNVTLTNATISKAIALGDGNDLLDITSFAALATLGTGVNGGVGAADVVRMTAALAVLGSADNTFATKVTNFERLELTAATGTKTVALGQLGGYHYVTVGGADGTTALTLTGFATSDTLILTTGNTAATFTLEPSGFGGLTTTFNLQLNNGSATNFGTISAVGVETANIALTGGVQHTLSWQSPDTTVINITGGVSSLDLTANSTALTTLDASASGGLAYTSAALAGAATIKGSLTGTNTVTFSAATGGVVTYTGGSGADTIVGSNGQNNIVNLGNGTNSYTATTGNHNVTGGTGVDTISVGDGNNTIIGGGGNDLITVGKGTNGVTVGTGDATVTVTGGTSDTVFTTITGFNANDKLAISQTGTAAAITSLGAQASVAAGLAAAASGHAAAAADSVWSWFTFGGDTYVVVDRDNGDPFLAGTDIVVKLVGAHDLGTQTPVAAVGVSTVTLVS